MKRGELRAILFLIPTQLKEDPHRHQGMKVYSLNLSFRLEIIRLHWREENHDDYVLIDLMLPIIVSKIMHKYKK